MPPHRKHALASARRPLKASASRVETTGQDTRRWFLPQTTQAWGGVASATRLGVEAEEAEEAEASVVFASAAFVSGLAPSDLAEPLLVDSTDFDDLDPELDET